MGTKIELKLVSHCDIGTIKSAFVNGLTVEFLIDKLQREIRAYKKEYELVEISDNFRDVIEENKNISFSTIGAWIDHKANVLQNLLDIVNRLDVAMKTVKKINEGEIVENFREELTEFALDLSLINITLDEVDYKNANVKAEYLKNVVEQLKIVDESQLLSELGNMSITMVPLEVERYRNVFIEEKLGRVNEIVDNVEKEMNRDFEKMHNQLIKMYEKIHSAIYEALTDEERFDKVRKIIKQIGQHRQVLDKQEDILTEANELKRQLKIHEKRLKDSLDDEIEGYKRRIKEFPESEEMYTREMESCKYVTENYYSQISNALNRIEVVEKDISAKYKIIDNLENVMKTIIPLTSEMERYSSLGFKFQDLLVRIELAKSQVDKKDKEFIAVMDTAITGLGVLVNQMTEGKDLFMRNTMLAGVFNSVNAIYDLVDNDNKSIEISQINFVTNKLSEYSDLCLSFQNDLQTFRRVSNNEIRDIAIILGKPIKAKNILDINNSVDIAIKQIEQILEMLKNNHNKQSELLSDILKV